MFRCINSGPYEQHVKDDVVAPVVGLVEGGGRGGGRRGGGRGGRGGAWGVGALREAVGQVVAAAGTVDEALRDALRVAERLAAHDLNGLDHVEVEVWLGGHVGAAVGDAVDGVVLLAADVAAHVVALGQPLEVTRGQREAVQHELRSFTKQK